MNEGVHSATTEHVCTVHIYVITDIPVWGVGEGTGVAGGDAVVGAGEHQSSRGKGRGVGVRGGGRGRGGRVTEGMKSKTPKMEHQKKVQVENLTN